MHYLRQGKQLLLAIFLKTWQKRHHNTSNTKYFSKTVFLTCYRFSRHFMWKTRKWLLLIFCIQNFAHIIKKIFCLIECSICCFVYPCILMIKVVCHTKFLYHRSLAFLIWSMLSLSKTWCWLWFFFLLFFRKRKIKYFSSKSNMTEPYFCYESVRNKIICYGGSLLAMRHSRYQATEKLCFNQFLRK